MHAKGRVHEEASRLDFKKRKEKTTPFGVDLMRSQVLNQAAQELEFEVFDCSVQCYADG